MIRERQGKVSFSIRSRKVMECQRESGKLAMTRGKLHFVTVSQGKYFIFDDN